MLLIASTCFGMAPKGGGLPGVVGQQASGDSYRPFTEEPPPCGPGNECNRETVLPERLTTPPQPEPTAIELPTTGSSCRECARISEDAAAHIVAATMARCQERCEARKAGVRRRLDTVNEEIQKLQMKLKEVMEALQRTTDDRNNTETEAVTCQGAVSSSHT